MQQALIGCIVAVSCLFLLGCVQQQTPCDVNGSCPSGSTCVAGLCQAVQGNASVPPLAQGPKKWTILVYLDGDNNLEEYALSDFNELESAGSTDDVNIVVQLDRSPEYDLSNGDWYGAKRFYVTRDSSPSLVTSQAVQSLGNVDSGDPNTLVNFALWGMRNYPADHYALVLWDHGDSWRGLLSDDTSYNRGMTLSQLEDAMSQIRASLGKKLDIIGFDACLMASYEVDTALMNYANIRIASEEMEPGNGWNFADTMAKLVWMPTMDASQLATNFVRDYKAFYDLEGDPTVTLAAVDLNKYPLIVDKMQAFSAQMKMAADTGFDEVFAIGKGRFYAEGYGRSYSGYGVTLSGRDETIDLMDFASLVNALTNSAALKHASAELINAMQDAIIAKAEGQAHYYSNGISVYFSKDEAGYDATYDMFTGLPWHDFIGAYYNRQGQDTVSPVVDYVRATSTRVSLSYPITLYSSVSDDNIATVMGAVFSMQDDQYLVLQDFAEVNPPEIPVSGGAYIAGWAPGANTFNITWDSSVIALSNGYEQTHIILDPLARESSYYATYGVYVSPYGRMNATLVFDLNDGALVASWDSDNQNEFVPQYGATFIPYEVALDLDTEEFNTYEGLPITVYENGLSVENSYLLDDTYYLTVIPQDFAGNVGIDYVEVNVTNGS